MEGENLCVECLHNITNPICTECMFKDFKRWVADLDISGAQKFLIVGLARKEIMKVDSLNDERCILCGHENLTICSYCFFIKMARVLKKVEVGSMALANFYKIFNTENEN